MRSCATGKADLFTQINVTANPLWTDTGIILTAGQAVSITASGLWAVGENGGVPDLFGPDGYTPVSAPHTWDRFLDSGVNQGRLIAYIGSDPFQGHWGGGSFFPQTTGYISIGSSFGFAADKSGELWLGCNDDAVSMAIGDNSGFATAVITVVPEPSILAMSIMAGVMLLYRPFSGELDSLISCLREAGSCGGLGR